MFALPSKAEIRSSKAHLNSPNFSARASSAEHFPIWISPAFERREPSPCQPELCPSIRRGRRREGPSTLQSRAFSWSTPLERP